MIYGRLRPHKIRISLHIRLAFVIVYSSEHSAACSVIRVLKSLHIIAFQPANKLFFVRGCIYNIIKVPLLAIIHIKAKQIVGYEVWNERRIKKTRN